jgi:hypothetical protein
MSLPTNHTELEINSYTESPTLLGKAIKAVGNALGLFSLDTKLAGEDLTNDVMKVEQRFSNSYISTATTTTVKSGAGFLHSITIGETAAGAITIYDNTAGSGTVLAVLKASIAEQTFTFNTPYSTGLTIVTAAASKLTVSYR